MEVCEACKQDLNSGASCNKVILLANGKQLSPVPFPGISIDELKKGLMWWNKSSVNNQARKQAIKNIEEKIEVLKRGEKARCDDCGVFTGGIHHQGCEMERCPKCASQLIGCDCRG